MKRLFFSILLLAAAGEADAVPGIYARLGDLRRLGQPQSGSIHHFASTDPCGGNADSGNFIRIEPPGAGFQEGDWVLAEFKGSGSIAYVWMTGKDKEGNAPFLAGRIRIYLDKMSAPTLDVELNRFFGEFGVFQPPFAQQTNGAHVSYVPLPFRRYCKVVVTDRQDRYGHLTNGCKQDIPDFQYHIAIRTFSKREHLGVFRVPPSPEQSGYLEAAGKLFNQTDRQLRNGQGPIRFTSSSPAVAARSWRAWSAPGPGIVRRMEIAGDLEDLRGLRLYITYGNNDQPSIDAPLAAFFGIYDSSPENCGLLVGWNGGEFYSNLPIPCRSASIDLEAPENGSVRAECRIWWEESVDPGPMRLQAVHRLEDTAGQGKDYLVVPKAAGSGHYVGCTMRLDRRGLEGKESIHVDGSVPWVGTGTVDYFNGGWSFGRTPFIAPLFGTLSAGINPVVYRFHLLDCVPFRESLAVSLEHGHKNSVSARYESVGFFYQKQEI